MSYNPPKGMYKTNEGVAVFHDRGTAPEPGAGKRWWTGTVIRTVVNSKGDSSKRTKQVARVFAKESDVAGFLIRQCPDTFQSSEGDVKVKISWVAG